MKQMINIKKKSVLPLFDLVYILILLPLLFSCDKRDNPVPVARFSVTIDLSLPPYNRDAFVVNYYNGRIVGIAGVLVLRKLTGDGYNVFERYCPHDQKISCKAEFDEDFATATCTCCESQFLIANPDGDVVEGPSVYPLKTYKSKLDGNRLTIYN